MKYRIRTYRRGTPILTHDVTTSSERVAADELAQRALRYGWDDVALLAAGERPLRGADAQEWALRQADVGEVLTVEARHLLGLLATAGVMGLDLRDTAWTGIARLELEVRDLADTNYGQQRTRITLDGARLALRAT